MMKLLSSDLREDKARNLYFCYNAVRMKTASLLHTFTVPTFNVTVEESGCVSLVS